jgi:hypothetical protein
MYNNNIQRAEADKLKRVVTQTIIILLSLLFYPSLVFAANKKIVITQIVSLNEAKRNILTQFQCFIRLLSKLNMVEEFLGIRFYKKRSVVDLHEHFLGSNDNKITHQMTFRKKSIRTRHILEELKNFGFEAHKNLDIIEVPDNLKNNME